MPGSIGVPDNRSAAILAEAGRGDNGLIVMISVWMSIYAAPDEREKANERAWDDAMRPVEGCGFDSKHKRKMDALRDQSD